MKVGKKSLLAFLSVVFFSFTFVQTVEAAEVDVANESIAANLTGTTATNLIVVPSPDGGDAKEYESSNNGLKQALYDLYQKGNNGNFAIYIGTGFTISGTADKVVPAVPDASNMTFMALAGKVDTLVLTSTTADVISDNTGAATGAKTLAFGTNAFMGTNLILRNITHTGTNLYMNGYDLSLNGNSHGTGGKNIFGGTDSTDVTGSPTITVNATGAGTWNFYGGNNTGGTLTGSTSLLFKNTTDAVANIVGGARVGTVTGDVDVRITGFKGAISNGFYAGGMGTSTSLTANVGGNVTTEINVMDSSTSFRLSSSTIYGGVEYGNIAGTINTTIKGYGGFTAATISGAAGSPGFVGGSRIGDIGSDKNQTAITNTIDTSQYSSGRSMFTGGNVTSGTILGGIDNTLRAGSNNAGSFMRAYGGGGNNINTLSAAQLGVGSTAGQNAFDAYTKEERKAIAENAATFKVYGDIMLNILGGCVSNDSDDGYTRAAGYGGYIEGDTTVILGTLNEDNSTGGAGLVYSQYTANNNLNNLDYNKAKNNRAYRTGYDVVGGGGTPGGYWSIYIYGRTKVINNNSVARWTYGGNFSGIVEHPDGIDADTYASSYLMYDGIADTTEGSGYISQRTYGPSHTEIYNGQVDWFTSGGGWGDWKQFGDASVVFHTGIHNGTVGGTYGYNNSHEINGDVFVTILGGDFSGSPSHTGNKNFSAGPSDSGIINGSATLTIDLTTELGSTFVPPPSVNITAGRYEGAGTGVNLGTGDSTVTLNIYANEESGDVLNGATIYGDGGTSATPSKLSEINMNIDVPGSTIGTLYATQYSNITGGTLLRNVNVNVQRAKSIGGISGGNAGDNITNAVAASSAAVNRYSTFKVGVPVSDEEEYQKSPILVSGLGLINFTSLLVDNGTTLTASSGNIKNGGSATAVNHAATYSDFGNITLKNNAGLGVTGTNAFISGGLLTITDENQLESGQGTGIINISDIEFTDPDNSRLTWVKNNIATTPSVTGNGTWFGTQTAYQVLTFNGVNSSYIQNASKITPFNFKGIEKATGKTFIGDNDVTGAVNGYGIMIPGSVIDYVVKDPVVDGKGDIEHNVTDVRLNNQPTPLKVWGTEVAGTKVQKGRLIIPSSSNILPTLTFTPETATTGSWLYNANIVSTKIGATAEVVDEQLNSEPVTWSSTDGSYSYEVEVRYSNEVELDARSIILTEAEAATITKSTIEEYTEVNGRPFLASTIDNVLSEIQAPLETDEYSRKTEVTYKVGTAAINPTNVLEKTVNVIVVKEGSKVSADRHGAIYAEDAILRLQEVHDLAGDQIAFEQQYTKVHSFKSDGTTAADGTMSTDVTADAATYFDRLSALTDADVQDDSKVTYKLQYGTEVSEVVSTTVNITVMPNTTTFIIKFVDEDGSELHEPITSTETIGSTVNLVTHPGVLAAISTVEAQRYVLESRPGPDESAIKIVNGGTTVAYKFRGILSLSAPDVIDFKTHAVTMNDTRMETPELKKTDQSATKLTVFDNRATKKSWTLTAKLTGTMANTEDETKILADAIKFNNGTTEEALTGAETTIKKHQHDDDGNYVVSDDWSAGGAGLKLEVPAGSVKKLGKYQAEITWVLGDTPIP